VSAELLRDWPRELRIATRERIEGSSNTSQALAIHLLNQLEAALDERDAAIRRASDVSDAVQAYLDADGAPAYSWVDEGQRERRGEPNREKERRAKVAAARAALRAVLGECG